MKIDILTLFPEFISTILDWSIIGRACDEHIVEINSINIRDFSKNKHKKVDDYPFGGGAGMVMQPEPIFDAISSVKSPNSRVIYLSPQGKSFDQCLANELSKETHLILLCGHYEGVDNRIIENYVDEEVSIGDYVLTGGEIPAMVLLDSIIRLLPGVLRTDESFIEDSHYNGLLEYPQYTRPREFNGHCVPEVLLSGNHGRIKSWRREESLKATLKKRPDLLKDRIFTKEEKVILDKVNSQLEDKN
ncbi:tRNA (guanosine(37)-N1)-methyltransferase TrmD [Tissierella sp.]|uniref:tRNA (guanosine(37)-N1)-methyltransferase TrmD n=1 Tax=Tissierella sp. TaxID=41274 RepID=UPI0028581E70|nr:tRNA (guanosine(37)-N1)-methyltransferase TrmD [Tissierella sp.]MDR7856356.1 tRNA (guanosine(37)-N1)-methyltransferase TrmD [Tissierella sp.]